ncbi:MAG: bifunctional adenosylcobinamide kinase/adenosylcobinamide-phosphate guanylyltransferase [Panacagrimonas sp.]
MRTLILGGVRSGKSRLAERLAMNSGRSVIYIATAQAGDDAELAARIHTHRLHRPAHWRTVEAPIQLAHAIHESTAQGHCVLVDCLTLWLTNLLCAESPSTLPRERGALLEAIEACRGELILVGNETGLGVVPMGALSRRFVDEAGILHQRLATHCERVLFCAAGIPLALKGRIE